MRSIKLLIAIPTNILVNIFIVICVFYCERLSQRPLPTARTNRALCLLGGRAAGFPRHGSLLISARISNYAILCLVRKEWYAPSYLAPNLFSVTV